MNGGVVILFCGLFFGLSGCVLRPAPYREFVATVAYSELRTYVLEGPVVPINQNQAREVRRFRESLRETAAALMEERGFRSAAGLADADMVLEMEWRTSRAPSDPERVLDGSGGLEMDTLYHLNLRIFRLPSGTVFWRNAAAQPIGQKELTRLRAERMLRDTLGPLPAADDPVEFEDLEEADPGRD